jgi:hypothetical protein
MKMQEYGGFIVYSPVFIIIAGIFLLFSIISVLSALVCFAYIIYFVGQIAKKNESQVSSFPVAKNDMFEMGETVFYGKMCVWLTWVLMFALMFVYALMKTGRIDGLKNAVETSPILFFILILFLLLAVAGLVVFTYYPARVMQNKVIKMKIFAIEQILSNSISISSRTSARTIKIINNIWNSPDIIERKRSDRLASVLVLVGSVAAIIFTILQIAELLVPAVS